MIAEAKRPFTIPLARVHQYQQSAVVRLQIFAIGQVAERLLLVVEAGKRAVNRHKSQGGNVDGMAAYYVKQALYVAWDQFMKEYRQLLDVLTREAASLPVSMMATYHAHYFPPRIEESLEDELADLLNRVIQTARNETLGDNNPSQYSDRIWKLENDGRALIDHLVAVALANGTSAYELALQLEQFLAPGADCPRWAEERLRNLTKGQIASGDRLGLFSGDECRGQGVAYNALRLARTEIQRHLHAVTDYLFAQMPWVEEEKCNLSPAHVGRDQCDGVAEGGDNSDGTYPVGTIAYPLHPHCMCYKTAVLMDNDEFIRRLRGWTAGVEPWPEMDSYQNMLGGGDLFGLNFAASFIAAALQRWLTSEAGELIGGLGLQ